MHTIIISLLFLTSNLSSSYQAPIISLSEKDINSTVSVYVKFNNEPLEGVSVFIYQTEKNLGKGITDKTGSVDIVLNNISSDIKYADIKASKEGFQEYILKNSYISKTTKYEISMVKLSDDIPKSKTFQFEFQEEIIKNKK